MGANRRRLRRAREWRWEPPGAEMAVAATHGDQRWAEARAKAIAWAVGVAGDPRVVYLDTETTGFGPRAEIVDIAVIDAAGQVLLESLVQPTRRIPAVTTAIHGITDDDVAHAPAWCDLYDEVARVLVGRRIVVYNVTFDRQMVTQACGQYALAVPEADWDCAMRRYAGFHGSWDGRKRWYRFQKLERAVLTFGAEPGGHRAVADAIACRAVVLGMAATVPPEPDADTVTPDLTARPWHVPATPRDSAGSLVMGEAGELLARWASAAHAFLALVEDLPAELRDRPGACGEWSVRQIVAHAAAWEWEAARRLRLIAADPTLPDAVYDVDRFNAASVTVRDRQGWTRTVDELAKASNTLGVAATALPHDRRTREWLRGRAADFEEHTAALRSWIGESASPRRNRGLGEEKARQPLENGDYLA